MNVSILYYEILESGNMSEVGDEVGEGPHVTQRVVPDVSPDVSTSTDYGYISDKYEDDDYETLIAKLKEHLKDTLASDIQVGLKLSRDLRTSVLTNIYFGPNQISNIICLSKIDRIE